MISTTMREAKPLLRPPICDRSGTPHFGCCGMHSSVFEQPFGFSLQLDPLSVYFQTLHSFFVP